MSSKPPEQSIASQLVFLFTLAAAVLLCCGLGLFYLLVVRHAFDEDNEFLADKIIALRADLGTPNWLNSVNAELKNRHVGEPAAYSIRILDSNGRTLVETPGMAELLPSRVFSPQSPNSAIHHPTSYRAGGKLFSLIAFYDQAAGQRYTVHVAQDRSADEHFTRRFGALVILVLGLGIGASAVIAVTVTRRGLRPLGNMTQALQRVGPARLHERLSPVGWPRELQPLALAFDQMLDRLEDSFGRLSQFSADLAHELRTPVGNLLGEAQVILSRERELKEYRQVIESSVAECERLSGIIDNLLFLARAEAAKEQIIRSRFNARAAAEKIAAFYQTIADEQQITVSCTGQGEVEAEPTLFDRALGNLIENALRFTPKGGTIQIEISGDSEGCQISVKDNGSGIAKEHLPHVFDRLYRVDPSRSSEGAGLGLALVKSIAELHGGQATIQSEENGGTTVTITFPHQIARA